MEDTTFCVIRDQIHETEEVLELHKRYHDNVEQGNPLDLILKNQVAIMKALDHIDTDIQSIPR